MLDKRSVLLVKDEVTYNTDSVPVAATNAVLVEDAKWDWEGARMFQQKPVRPSLAMLKPLFAGTLIKISGKAEIKGSGAAGTPPEVGALLRAAAMSETVVGATSVTYKPVSDPANHKSSSVYFYDDGLLLKLTGCRAKINFAFQLGAVAFVHFDIVGHFVSVTDVALAAPTYSSQVPVPLVNVPFTWGTFAATISKLDFDLGNELVMPGDISKADGYGTIDVVGRKVTGSIDPLRVAVASRDFISNWRNGTSGVLDTGVIGGTAGNRLQVTMPVVTPTAMGRGNRSQFGTFEMKFAATESAGDDDVSVIFT
jgi:hypothetical protein